VASQKRIDAQDTELNSKLGDVGRTDHEVPFQLNANLSPTAMQKSTEVQETDVSGIGRGKGCGCQDEPFHISVSTGCGFAELSPAAMQNRAETQDTAFSDKWMALSSCDGSGVFWILHLAPFQASASPMRLPLPPRCEPTASQRLAETHDTAPSELDVALAGWTMRWCCQELPFQISASPRTVGPTNDPVLSNSK
jgi:hypothetical protein